MWEFSLINRNTKKQIIILGYSLKDAFRRHPSLDPEDWECMMADYID